MSENKIDDLFKSNDDYLADQPHRDFDPEAFWQQLRPELAPPKKKRAGWWWASAAAVGLAILATGAWWAHSDQQAPGVPVAHQPAVVRPEVPAPAKPVSEPSASPEKNDSESQVAKTDVAERRKPAAPSVEEKVPPLVEKSPGTTLPAPEVAQVAVTVPGSTPDPLAEQPAPPNPPAEPVKPKPKYRIVHLNEIQPRKQPTSESRPQVALRIGVKGTAASSPVEASLPLAIPINN
jgi:hypothetical protein